MFQRRFSLIRSLKTLISNYRKRHRFYSSFRILAGADEGIE
jgi:hypothetical protein